MERETDILTTEAFLAEPLNTKPEPRRCGSKVKQHLLDNLLLVTTIGGVLLGFVIGFGVRETHPSQDALMWLGLPGQLYLRVLKMMIVPLIICSVLSGTASLDPKSNGKISLVAFIFIICTNAIGSGLGIAGALIFKPGLGDKGSGGVADKGVMQTQDILADLIRNIFPDNLFSATFQSTQTKYTSEESQVSRNTTNGTITETVVTVTKYLGAMNGANIIGLIFACTLLGIAAGSLKDKGKPFLDFFISASETVILVVRWFMWATPVGVASLIAVSVASITSIEDVFAQLGLLIATVTVGIFVQQILIMTAILFVFTRRNPFAYLISIAKPWMIAFAATSTAVAIPEMLTACEEKNKIDKRVSRFVVPFSVTLSCNGSALYIAASCIFIINLTGSPANVADVLLVWLLVTIAAMAIPSIPSASIMTVIMILTSMNIAVDDIALLLAVEWYLDRIRSTSSVVSHTFCTAVVYSFVKKDLEARDQHLKRNETVITVVTDSGSVSSAGSSTSSIVKKPLKSDTYISIKTFDTEDIV